MKSLAGFTRIHIAGGSTKFLAELKAGDVLANGKKILSVTHRKIPEDFSVQMKEIGKGILVEGEGKPVYIDFIFDLNADGPVPLVDDLGEVYEF